jgi:hypothetical protein
MLPDLEGRWTVESRADLYSPPESATADGFLARYRRPVWEPLAARYVAAWTRPGDLLLDPFCQDASVIRAAVAAGRRVVAITGNPLLALLVRVEAVPPPAMALLSALRQLQYAPKLDTTLGAHLDALYATSCSRCARQVPATAFTWDRAANQPVLRDYSCPHCQHTAREPVPLEEVAGHLAHDPQGFHRRLVAERLRVDGGHRRLERRLLDLYTPRNVYALASLLLKIELLYAAGPVPDALRAALLHTLDVASKLNRVTEEGWRPVHSLRPPRQFREVNVWRAFVEAVETICAWPGSGVVLAPSLEQAAASDREQGCRAYAGLEALPKVAVRLQGQVVLALSQLPRFDPTFAALSYLWSGWLLGKGGSRAAERLLRQRAPEEARYVRALRSSLAALSPALAPEGRLALLFQAPATRYLEALHVAAAAAGLSLEHAWHGVLDDLPAARFGARRVEHHLVFGQPAARRGGVTSRLLPADPAQRAQAVAARTSERILRQRAEPAPFTALHGPIWDALAREGLLAPGAEGPDEVGRRAGAAVQKGLEDALGSALSVATVGGDPERAVWWLQAPPTQATPLADRVEALVRELLLRGAALDEIALQEQLAQRLPPPLTAAWRLVLACLAAYGVTVGPRLWALADGEQPASVATWRARLLCDLTGLGERLDYEVQAATVRCQPALEGWPGGISMADYDLAWLESGQMAYAFAVREVAASADLRAMAPPAAGRRVLAIPERRVALWSHKLTVAPQWSAELERAGWAFLRERALEGLLAQPADRGRFAAALGLDEPGAQLALFA